MIHHHILQELSQSNSTVAEVYNSATEKQVEAFVKIRTYVLITILVLLVQLGHLIRPFAYGFFRLLSWLSYILIPSLISYILGLMGRFEDVQDSNGEKYVEAFRYMTCVWIIFLLFAHAGFDNLNAFSLGERQGRSKLVVQVGIQLSLLVLVLYKLPENASVGPLCFAFLVLICKFVGRVVGLAHSAGATPRMKKEVARVINYMNHQPEAQLPVEGADPKRMIGCNYLVGPRYSKVKEDGEGLTIEQGITVEQIWNSTEARLLESENEQLKDTCLSFALFWLLLGKIEGYPLYSKASRDKAWKLVRHGLLSEKGNRHERVFRVIEIELAFLRDYFHAKYIFFYLNSFYLKIISVVALPIMFKWFIDTTDHFDVLNHNNLYDGLNFTDVANWIVISVIVALEAMQLVVLLCSRWLKVTLYCLYVKKASSKTTWYLTHIFLEVLGYIFLGSSRRSNHAWWRKPWKRELDQYSLVRSCTTLFKPSSYLKIHFSSIVGVPLKKPGWKLSKPVKLSDEVKEAVVVCLQRNDACPKLDNGAQSLKRNGVLEWSYKLMNDTETIVVWHIATSVCEFEDAKSASTPNMKVANELSKYCAYLLFFAPSLLPVPALESESICTAVIKEARKNFNKPFFGCCKSENSQMHENLKKLISDSKEEGVKNGRGKSLIIKGAELGQRLVDEIHDKEKRWKILAEFWAEMILYLAPSNHNEMAHAEKLSQGGEFITQLWALLVHAGISNRDDMAAALKQDDDVV